MAAIVLVTAALSGCAISSGLDPTVKQSGFDGATVVSIEPHGNVCAEFCSQVGAQWNSKDPERAILTLQVLGYTGFHAIRGADLRIGEEIVSLSPNPGLTTHKKRDGVSLYESQKDFTVPLDLVRRIISSSDVWLRIQTNEGWIDDAIIANGKDSKGLNALKRFIAQVDAHQ